MVYGTGELLTMDMDKDSIMVLQVILAEIMVKTKPSIYRKLVTIKNGRTVQYIKFQKSLYSVLLFYEDLVVELN